MFELLSPGPSIRSKWYSRHVPMAFILAALALTGCGETPGEPSPEAEAVHTVAQAVDINASYDSGIWAVPTDGAITDRLYGVSAQFCADYCAARQDCSGFYAFTDWDVCNLFGAAAETAGRAGPWSNVRMYWKKKSVDAQNYASGFWAVPNTGFISDTLYGYTPAQCSQQCESKADCTGFYAFTDSLQCRLQGPATEFTSGTNGPWTNVQVYQRKRTPKALLVDVKVLTSSTGGNELWSEAYTRKVISEATRLLEGDMVFTLASYERIVNDALYNGNTQGDVLGSYVSTRRDGRVTVYISNPNTWDSAGLAYQGTTLAPYLVMRSRQNDGSASDFEETARIFLHELGHNMGFTHGDIERVQYPFSTDWYWQVPAARQVVAKLADWSRLHLVGLNPNIKSEGFDCAVNGGVPTQGQLLQPHFDASSANECAARCAQNPDCVSFYKWTDANVCVLYGAASIGTAGQGWLNVETCWKRANVTDMALGRPALQSSISWGGAASRAVDGNTDGVYNDNSVTHTADEYQPWWQVDLQGSRSISKVVLFNRTDCCSDRLSNFKVLVSDDGSSWQAFSYTGTAPQQLEFPMARTGRFVKVQLEGSNVPLSLAEVKVY